MTEYDFRFRNMSDYNYTYSTPIQWQAWHEAYFQRVESILHADGEYIRLLNMGCTTDSWTTPNCTRTCSNSTAMFSSPANVWNCIALATVTMEVVQNNKTLDPDSFQYMDGIFDLGGSPKAFDDLNVFLKMRQCFWQSCTDSRYGNCTTGFVKFKCDPVAPSNIQDFATAILQPYCEDGALSVDSDIAGPGILVAYMIQMGLVFIFATLFWSTYRPWTRLYNLVRQASAVKRTGEPQPEASEPKPSSRFTKAVQRTVSELQKAQTAFGATIGVIFLLAFVGDGSIGLANLSSVFSYTINRDIAFGLLVVGTCSIVFLQPCYHRVSERGYVSIVPLLAWILMLIAECFRITGSWANPKTFWKNLKENAALTDCGGNPGPMSYCLGPQLQGPDQSQQVFELTIRLAPAVHCMAAVVLLEGLVRWYFHSRRSRETDDTGSSLPGLFGTLDERIMHPTLAHIHRIFSFVMPAIILLGFGLLIICCIDVVKALKKIQSWNGGQNSWGFGQLAAIAVWIPIIVEFFIFLIGLWLGWIMTQFKQDVPTQDYKKVGT